MPQSPSPSPSMAEVVEFLCGEAPLDGVWFGDPPPPGRGPFWWRKHLRAALQQQEAGSGLTSFRDAQALAARFHEAYERLAPSFGYETRPETRALDLQSANGRLMVAVCQELALRSLPHAAERGRQ